jgi:uncharacterized SAM-binding protein YcdF (DUF218 family)
METTFFIAAKCAALLLRAETWLVLLTLAAVLTLTLGSDTRQQLRRGRGWLLALLVVILGIGMLPLGAMMLRPLEARFAAQPEIENPAGIIILGGAEDPKLTLAHGLPALNEAGERFVEGIALARRYPDALVVFSGGSAEGFGTGPSGAAVAAQIFHDAGIPEVRFRLEGASRNTAENARLSHAHLAQALTTDRPWVLVTSAFHMPRAVGAFCSAGFRNLIPYPVDFRSGVQFELDWDLSAGLARFNTGLKEWIGLVAYVATGRSTQLVPNNC